MSVLGKVRSSYKKTKTAVGSLDEAAAQFGRTLVREGKKDLAREGSAAQRFADAPLGQYYLPSGARKALSFVAPSPRKVVRDTRNVSRNPGPGNLAAAGGNVLSIATLPLAGAQGARAAGATARAGKALRVTKGLALTERIGLAARSAATPNAVFHGTTQTAARGIRAGGFREGFAGRGVFTTRDVGKAAQYARQRAREAQGIAGSAGAKPAIVAAKVTKGAVNFAEPHQARLGIRADFAQNVRAFASSERGSLRIPTNKQIIRTKTKVMDRLREGFPYRTPDTGRKIDEVREQIRRIDAAEDLHRNAPTSLRNLSNIRDKVRPKGGDLPQGLREGERGSFGFGKPGRGKKPNSAAAEVVRRANNKAIGAKLRHAVGEKRQMLSMEGNASVKLWAKGGAPDPAIVKLAQKELKLRNVMRSQGIDAGKVVREVPSQIDVEGRMPLRQALARLGNTDFNNRVSQWEGVGSWDIEKNVTSLPKMKRVHPGRLPRN